MPARPFACQHTTNLVCLCRSIHLQGNYQQLDIIGKGAFACVYKARHLPTGRLVCIKTLEAVTGTNQAEDLAREMREVAVLAALAAHPNIIRWEMTGQTHASYLWSTPATARQDSCSCQWYMLRPCST